MHQPHSAHQENPRITPVLALTADADKGRAYPAFTTCQQVHRGGRPCGGLKHE